MISLFQYPFLTFAFSFFAFWLSAQIGVWLRRRWPQMEEAVHKDLDVVLGAVLTLLGLIIGFSFSMAISRYEQRKTYEVSEANAIGTEYVRADLMPAADAAKMHELMREYLEQRILFYTATSEEEIPPINAATAHLQTEMWAAVHASFLAEPTPALALVASGMNDVLNSVGYTQAAWWNRIPAEAWWLMSAIAICSNMLVSYSRHCPKTPLIRFLVLPFVLSIAFFAMADIDSPRRGLIRVPPENLNSLAQSLQGR
jgi:hypothetical protein